MDKSFMHTFEVGNFHLNHLSLFNQKLVMHKSNSIDLKELRRITKNQCAGIRGCISCMLITFIS